MDAKTRESVEAAYVQLIVDGDVLRTYSVEAWMQMDDESPIWDAIEKAGIDVDGCDESIDHPAYLDTYLDRIKCDRLFLKTGFYTTIIGCAKVAVISIAKFSISFQTMKKLAMKSVLRFYGCTIQTQRPLTVS